MCLSRSARFNCDREVTHILYSEKHRFCAIPSSHRLRPFLYPFVSCSPRPPLQSRVPATYHYRPSFLSPVFPVCHLSRPIPHRFISVIGLSDWGNTPGRRQSLMSFRVLHTDRVYRRASTRHRHEQFPCTTTIPSAATTTTAASSHRFLSPRFLPSGWRWKREWEQVSLYCCWGWL